MINTKLKHALCLRAAGWPAGCCVWGQQRRQQQREAEPGPAERVPEEDGEQRRRLQLTRVPQPQPTTTALPPGGWEWDYRVLTHSVADPEHFGYDNWRISCAGRSCGFLGVESRAFTGLDYIILRTMNSILLITIIVGMVPVAANVESIQILGNDAH